MLSVVKLGEMGFMCRNLTWKLSRPCNRLHAFVHYNAQTDANVSVDLWQKMNCFAKNSIWPRLPIEREGEYQRN